MSKFPQAGAQQDNLALILPDTGGGIAIDRWLHYSFNSDFLCPADAWTLTTAGQYLDIDITDSLRAGARVLLKINGKTQGGGIIHTVEVRHSRGQGLTYTIHGRDAFGPVVDAGADPNLFQFTREQTLEDVIKTVFGRFGYTKDEQFVISNDANRTVMTGVRTTTKGGKKGPRPLRAIKIAQQLHPYPGEGCFAFVTRFLHRFGLWCWPSADQSTVIVDEPHYDQPPIATVVRRRDGTSSNVIDGVLRQDACDQPSAILATGYAGPNVEFSRSKLKVIVINELTGIEVDVSETSKQLTPTGPVLGIISRNPDAVVMPTRDSFLGYMGKFFRPDTYARPMFLHDDEAKTLDQLQRFARREMSLRQQRMWSAHYTVLGHTQNGIPWTVDTIVMVDDDELDFHGPMWVRGRTFEKDRSGGTVTHLDLILPNTLAFGD